MVTYKYSAKDITDSINKKYYSDIYQKYEHQDLLKYITKAFNDNNFERKLIKNTYFYTEGFKNFCIENIDLSSIPRKERPHLIECLPNKNLVKLFDTVYTPQSNIVNLLNNLFREHNIEISKSKAQHILKKASNNLDVINVYTINYNYHNSFRKCYSLDDFEKIIDVFINYYNLDNHTIKNELLSYIKYYNAKNDLTTEVKIHD